MPIQKEIFWKENSSIRGKLGCCIGMDIPLRLLTSKLSMQALHRLSLFIHMAKGKKLIGHFYMV